MTRDKFEFVWTFPTYLLARNFVVDPATGNILFNRDLQFIAPAVNPSGEQGIAMFTDRDLAEEYLAQTNPALGMSLLELSGPTQLRDFLRHAPRKYRYVAVDPNRTTRIIRGILIPAVLAAIEGRDKPSG